MDLQILRPLQNTGKWTQNDHEREQRREVLREVREALPALNIVRRERVYGRTRATIFRLAWRNMDRYSSIGKGCFASETKLFGEMKIKERCASGIPIHTFLSEELFLGKLVEQCFYCGFQLCVITPKLIGRAVVYQDFRLQLRILGIIAIPNGSP